MAVLNKKQGIFYGWWLLGAGTIIMVMQGGLYAYGFPLFFVPLAATLGTSRGALSLAFSFTRLESSLLGPIEGYMIDRFGPRGIMYVGFGLLGVSFILFSMVNSLLGFYLVFPIVALGASLSGFLPVVTAVNNWFSRRRGLATGISSAGVNMGGVVLALMALAISSYGWAHDRRADRRVDHGPGLPLGGDDSTPASALRIPARRRRANRGRRFRGRRVIASGGYARFHTKAGTQDPPRSG